MSWLQAFFNTPARQALGWTVLGILGIFMAAGGVYFLTDNGGGSKRVDAGQETPAATSTATPTRTPTLVPSLTPSPSPSASPTSATTATPTTRPATNASTGSGSNGGGSSSGGSSGQAPEPTPIPTPPPVVAGGDYCPNASSSSPPNSVIGIFTISGEPAPAGTSVSLAFDGVVGPTRATTAAGGYRVDYFAGPEGCANRVGASISVVYNGQFFATGHSVGDSPGAPVNVTIAIP